MDEQAEIFKLERVTVNIVLHGEGLKAFSAASRMRQGCPPLPRLLNIVMEVLATAVGQEKEIKGMEIEKSEVNYL